MDWQHFCFEYQLQTDKQRSELIQIEAYKEAAVGSPAGLEGST